ncbi:hypothetical protein LUZ63_007796 [Rhynchospora breviuscula]|uniref:Uncharacterized protein n=1 Tax=Rhynchospora breviuscula TaxID=2022672 RepID=A0A9Q0HUR9_9POAL|nr:hypothetical protein LUZ63_007796 [Rhynchospora breviuscula]
MFLVDWLYGILVSLGLWQKKAEIIFLGLDNAGKTMLLYSLKNDSMLKANPEKTVLLHAWNDKHRPTRHPRSKQLKIGKIKFTVFDLGGHEIVRRIFWKVYYAKMDAIVYLVDAHDKERFAESKKELDALLSDESLAAVPFLILGNKIDIPFAASEKELRFHLGLTDNTTGKGKVKLANSSVRPIEAVGYRRMVAKLVTLLPSL